MGSISVFVERSKIITVVFQVFDLFCDFRTGLLKFVPCSLYSRMEITFVEISQNIVQRCISIRAFLSSWSRNLPYIEKEPRLERRRCLSEIEKLQSSNKLYLNNSVVTFLISSSLTFTYVSLELKSPYC